MNIEEMKLDTWKKEKSTVTVFLVNGVKLRGSLIDYSDNIIILSSPNGGDQILYKSAITTISPE